VTVLGPFGRAHEGRASASRRSRGLLSRDSRPWPIVHDCEQRVRRRRGPPACAGRAPDQPRTHSRLVDHRMRSQALRRWSRVRRLTRARGPDPRAAASRNRGGRAGRSDVHTPKPGHRTSVTPPPKHTSAARCPPWRKRVFARRDYPSSHPTRHRSVCRMRIWAVVLPASTVPARF
jgi:hypothetical protein